VDKFFRQFPDQPEMKQARGLTRLRKNLLELAEESYRKELREHGSREKGRKQEKAEKAREKGGRKGTYLREKGGRKGTYLGRKGTYLNAIGKKQLGRRERRKGTYLNAIGKKQLYPLLSL
jgi:hypothetical protein